METNEELNRWAHSFLGKKMPEPEVCPLCNVSHASDKALFNKKLKALPDYCSEDSPRSLVAKLEAKAIEMVGAENYLNSLVVGVEDPLDMFCAPALNRVQAAKRAVEGIK